MDRYEILWLFIAILLGYIVQKDAEKVERGDGRIYHYILFYTSLAAMFIIGFLLMIAGIVSIVDRYYTLGIALALLSLIPFCGTWFGVRRIVDMKKDKIGRDRRKARIEEHKFENPVCGVFSFKNLKTGICFLDVSVDVNKERNDVTYNVSRTRKNFVNFVRPMILCDDFVKLWKEDGEDGFEFSVIEKLEKNQVKGRSLEELQEIIYENIDRIENSKRLKLI